MIFLIAAILGVIAGIAVGGRLSNLLDFRIKKTWIIILAFAIMTITRILGLKYQDVNNYSIAFHVIVYTLLLVCIFFNRHYIGTWFIGVGSLLNSFVMLVNGGKMPVSADKALEAGMALESVNQDIKHILFYKNSEINIPFLADIIHLPGVLGLGMQIVSIGDLIISFGILVIIYENVRVMSKTN